MITLIADHGQTILNGFFWTIAIVGTGFAAGSVLGILLSLALVSDKRVARWLARSYVELLRNTPFLIQAMLLFALLGVLRWRIEPLLVGTVSIALYTAAYMAEIIRGGLHSIPAAQSEGAKALALSPFMTFRLVILPQLLPFVLPASVNLLATVCKESAFLATVSVAELTFSGQVVIAQTFLVFQVWAIIGALYLIIVLSIMYLANRLERRMAWVGARR